ncbi:hypothetical protein H6P81_013439 [Aristolochia fimbriata]|uniref:DUF3444 domain-containing protein n=1 Tax=Aristolochia fimbriata TaxID=158543 RepID=A0AAV7EHJ8_ARIFI|nr:hypothetical protein H6P81_013439 [Aristolochia fimbriata]
MRKRIQAMELAKYNPPLMKLLFQGSIRSFLFFHPNRNKFLGAKDDFKLIENTGTTILVHKKRSEHYMEREGGHPSNKDSVGKKKDGKKSRRSTHNKTSKECKQKKEVGRQQSSLVQVDSDIVARCHIYARIKRVFSPTFKVHFTWLEPNPTDEDEIAWVDVELPIAYGTNKHGGFDTSEMFGMFAYEVSWEKGVRGSYKIFPKKGEVWALYKDWDISWSCDPEKHKPYKCDIVELK